MQGLQGLMGPRGPSWVLLGPRGRRAFAQAPQGVTGGLVLGDADLTLGVWQGMVEGLYWGLSV